MKRLIPTLLCSAFLFLFCAGFAHTATAAPTATISPVPLECDLVCEEPSAAVDMEVMPTRADLETAEEMCDMIQAKFRCSRVDELKSTKYDRVPGAGIGGTDGFVDNGRREKYAECVYFHPVYATEGPNATWAKSTPSGELRMQVDNPAAWGAFEVDKEYLLTFEPAARAS